MGALCRFVHPMSLLQQLKEFLHWDSWVRRASQGEDLPQQHPVRPPEHTHTTTHTQTQWIQMRGQTAWSSQRWERGFRVPQINQWICLGKYWSSIMFTATNLRINLTFLLSGKVKSTTLHSSQKRDDSAERNGGRVFLCELNKDIGADSPGRHPLNWTSMRPVQSCPPQSSIFECLDLVVLKRMNYN